MKLRAMGGCNFCGGDAKLMACSQCHGVFYCSKKCQSLHWTAHHSYVCAGKPNCKMRVSVFENFETGLVATEDVSANVVLYDGPPDVYLFVLPHAEYTPRFIQDFLCPVGSHTTVWEGNEHADPDNNIVQLAWVLLNTKPNLCKRILGRAKMRSMPPLKFDPWPIFKRLPALTTMITRQEFYLLCSHVMSYSFNVDTTDNCIGLMYDDFIGRINHACDPNAVWTTLPNRMIVSTTRPISKGEEITISYQLTYCGFGADSRDVAGFMCTCTAHNTHLPKPMFIAINSTKGAFAIQKWTEKNPQTSLDMLAITSACDSFFRDKSVDFNTEKLVSLYGWVANNMWNICRVVPKNFPRLCNAWCKMLKFCLLSGDIDSAFEHCQAHIQRLDMTFGTNLGIAYVLFELYTFVIPHKHRYALLERLKLKFF